MTTITMLELRRNSEAILRRLGKGERMVLTYRGKPVARLEPLRDKLPNPDDPAYRLYEIADAEGAPLSNAEIDDIVYGA